MAVTPSARKHGPSSVHSTPAHMTVALLKFLSSLPSPYDGVMRKGVWECAAGSGAIARVVRTVLPNTPLIASDAFPPAVPDPDPLRRLTVPTPLDFTVFSRPASVPLPHLILTNPPFSASTLFIKSLTRLMEGQPYRIGAFLVPLSVLAGQRRYPLHVAFPPTALVIFPTRHAMYADGDTDKPENYDSPLCMTQGVIDYMWVVWVTDADGTFVPPQAIAPAMSWVKPHSGRSRTGPKPRPKPKRNKSDGDSACGRPEDDRADAGDVGEDR